MSASNFNNFSSIGQAIAYSPQYLPLRNNSKYLFIKYKYNSITGCTIFIDQFLGNSIEKMNDTKKEFQEQKKILLTLPKQTSVVSWKEAYVSFWKKSFDWSGRATRAEYWWPLFTNGLIGFIFGIVVAIIAIINHLDMMRGISLPTIMLLDPPI